MQPLKKALVALQMYCVMQTSTQSIYIMSVLTVQPLRCQVVWNLLPAYAPILHCCLSGRQQLYIMSSDLDGGLFQVYTLPACVDVYTFTLHNKRALYNPTSTHPKSRLCYDVYLEVDHSSWTSPGHNFAWRASI